jgi:multidrug efflux pump subunit AcrA (membrane-fusion protein)
MSSAVKFTRRLRSIGLPLIILLAAAAVFIYMSRTRPESKPIEASEKSWTVNVEQVQPAAWSVMLTLYGKVEFLWASSLAAGINADVLTVSIIEGDSVHEGDVLISLDERDADLVLQQAEADVAQAKARISAQQVRHDTDLVTLPRERKLLQLSSDEVTRQQDLTRKKVGSQSALDNARQSVERQAISVAKLRQSINEHEPKMAELESNLVRAQALQGKAELELERATVKAPFNGRIASVLVAPGRRVRMGDPLIEVLATDVLMLRALIPQRYLSVIYQARAAGHELQVSGILDDRQLTANLMNLTAQVNQGSGGVEALFQIQGDVSLLQQGRLLQLQLKLPEQPGLIALPQEAMYGTNQIYRVDPEHRLRLLEVERVGETTTGSGDSKVLIRAPQLQPGESVLVTQLPSAVDGLLVKFADQAN